MADLEITDSLLMAMDETEVRNIANSHLYTPVEYLMFKHQRVKAALARMMINYTYAEIEANEDLKRLMNHRRNSMSIIEAQLRGIK